MWRPEQEKTAPAESRYYNPRREYNGALAYAAPGIILSLPSHTRDLEVMFSESRGQEQVMNNCDHYRRSVHVQKPWLDRVDTWYSTNHTSPNPGKWFADPSPLSGFWGDGITSTNLPSPDIGLALGGWNSLNKGLPVLASPNVGHVGWSLFPHVDAVSTSLWQQDALKAMLPGLKASFSLPNTLFELKDMKTIARSTQRINDALDALKGALNGVSTREILKELFRTGSRKTLRSVLRASAANYLQWQFNFAPLLNDIAALQSACVNVRKEMRDLLRSANTPKKRHYSRDLGEIMPDGIQTLPFTCPTFVVYASGTAYRNVRYSIRKFNATIEYSYKLPSMTEAELGLRASMDKLGVNLNPAIIWNAIPWSFVIDWFVGVSRWLSQFQMRNIEPIVHIRGYCYSLHAIRTITGSLTYGVNAGPVSVVQEEAYTRKVGLDQPTITDALKVSGLNLKEFSLSAALFASR